MSTTQNANTYGTVTKTFHWLTALLILTVIPLGAIANRLPYETNEQLAFKAQLFSMHKTLGVIIFVVALGRILWALSQTKPGHLNPQRKVETFLAELVHWLLYISLVAVPLTGWIHHAATTGFAPIWLPISQDLPLVAKSEVIAKLFAGLHWAWSKIMVASILLHLTGALKHQIIDKDATLRRMWFGKSTVPPTQPHHSGIAAPLAAIAIYVAVTVLGAFAGLYAAAPASAQAALDAVPSEWTVTEGEIALEITQFGSPVRGSFGEWTSSIAFDETANGILGDVTTTISIGSVQLGSVTKQALDPDFFNAAQFPTAVFAGEITQSTAGYVANGTLTIKDVSVPVTLPFTLDLDGDTAAMSGAVTLDRRDFEIGQTMNDETNLAFAVDVIINLLAVRGE